MKGRAKNKQHAEYEILWHIMSDINLKSLREQMVIGKDAKAAKYAAKRFDSAADNIAEMLHNKMETRRRFLPTDHVEYEVKE